MHSLITSRDLYQSSRGLSPDLLLTCCTVRRSLLGLIDPSSVRVKKKKRSVAVPTEKVFHVHKCSLIAVSSTSVVKHVRVRVIPH